MTTPLHWVSGYVIARQCGLGEVESHLIGAAVSSSDWLAYYDHFNAMLEEQKRFHASATAGVWAVLGARDWSKLYAFMHSWKACLLVFTVPHCLIDKAWHKPGGGWYWWGYVLEPILWILICWIKFS